MATQPKLPTLWGVVQAAVVVFGLLLVLAYLFDPFARSDRNRQNPENTGCLTNLNQIAKASLIYLDDNNGYYWPSGQPYTTAVSRYLKFPEVFICKKDKRVAAPTDIDPATGQIVTGRSALRVSYLCNSNLWATKSGKLRISEILITSRFILLVDDSSGDGSHRACIANPNFASAYHAANQTGRHYGKDNYVMADTHVKAMKGGKNSDIADGTITCKEFTWDPAGDPTVYADY